MFFPTSPSRALRIPTFSEVWMLIREILENLSQVIITIIGIKTNVHGVNLLELFDDLSRVQR